MEDKSLQFGIERIFDLLPHRYPMLMVDRVLELVPNHMVKGIKNVTINEAFFQGHFPGEPIMPGVLILEAMAQLGIIFAKETDPEGLADKLLVFAGMDRVRFRKPVVPGDQLILELKLLKRKRFMWKMEGKARVDGALVAEAELMAAIQK